MKLSIFSISLSLFCKFNEIKDGATYLKQCLECKFSLVEYTSYNGY